MDLSEKTIAYYNTHAEEFIANTVSLEFSDKQMKFRSEERRVGKECM